MENSATEREEAILQREEKEVPALGGWWLFGPASPLRMGAPPFGAVVVLVLRVGGLRPRGVPSALRASACAALPRLSRARAPFFAVQPKSDNYTAAVWRRWLSSLFAR